MSGIPSPSLCESEDCESGDWFIRARRSEGCEEGDGVEAGDALESGESLASALGVEKAPVDCRCRRSKISCSSLGSRGGEGPEVKGEVVWWRVEMLNARYAMARRESRRGSRNVRFMVSVSGVDSRIAFSLILCGYVLF